MPWSRDCIWGLGHYFMVHGGPHPGLWGYIHGHRACLHKIKTHEARFWAFAPIDSSYCTCWCLVISLLYRVSRRGFMVLSCCPDLSSICKINFLDALLGLSSGYLPYLCPFEKTHAHGRPQPVSILPLYTYSKLEIKPLSLFGVQTPVALLV